MVRLHRSESIAFKVGPGLCEHFCSTTGAVRRQNIHRFRILKLHSSGKPT
jgi:hypothetical protein